MKFSQLSSKNTPKPFVKTDRLEITTIRTGHKMAGFKVTLDGKTTIFLASKPLVAFKKAEKIVGKIL